MNVRGASVSVSPASSILASNLLSLSQCLDEVSSLLLSSTSLALAVSLFGGEDPVAAHWERHNAVFLNQCPSSRIWESVSYTKQPPPRSRFQQWGFFGFPLMGGFDSHCNRTSEESEMIGKREEKKFVDGSLPTGKYPTI